jgi:hypothetical protein
LRVQPVAVFTQTVSARALTTFMVRDIAARRARIVVVADPMLRGLLDFID